MTRFISYLRVSTDGQGKSGLGIEAQRDSIARTISSNAGELVQEYVEIESGKRSDRPELAKALHHAKLTGSTLIVAKLDRLSRDQAFLMSVVKESGKDGVVFCDMPALSGPVGKFMLQQMAAVAELEAGLISGRTKAALQAAKERGVKLGGYRGVNVDGKLGAAANKMAADGFAQTVGPMIQGLRDSGLSLREIVAKLTVDGIKTARGGAWTPTAVLNVLSRLAA